MKWLSKQETDELEDSMNAADTIFDVLTVIADVEGGWHDLTGEQDVGDPGADRIFACATAVATFVLSHYPDGDVVLVSARVGQTFKKVCDTNCVQTRRLYDLLAARHPILEA